jgi:riboflavin kinase/FMN adenylyltransferase
MGKVIEGNKLGRKLGFPTANIETYDNNKLIPRDGVYAVTAEVEGKIYKGMLSIGVRPTVNTNEENRTVEVNLFDFDKDIYNSDLTLFFEERIRDEVKFPGVEELKFQMMKDRESVMKILTDQ